MIKPDPRLLEYGALMDITPQSTIRDLAASESLCKSEYDKIILNLDILGQ